MAATVRAAAVDRRRGARHGDDAGAPLVAYQQNIAEVQPEVLELLQDKALDPVMVGWKEQVFY